jgi:hypothetical protein
MANLSRAHFVCTMYPASRYGYSTSSNIKETYWILYFQFQEEINGSLPSTNDPCSDNLSLHCTAVQDKPLINVADRYSCAVSASVKCSCLCRKLLHSPSTCLEVFTVWHRILIKLVCLLLGSSTLLSYEIISSCTLERTKTLKTTRI